MSHVLLVSSSPSFHSPLEDITFLLRQELHRSGRSTTTLNLRDLPQSALLVGNQAHPRIRRTHEQLESSEAMVIVSPMYLIFGSTLLQAWLSLMPGESLARLPISPVGMGSTRGQAMGLRAILARHQTNRVLPGCFLYARWRGDSRKVTWSSPLADKLSHTVAHLCAEVDSRALIAS